MAPRHMPGGPKPFAMLSAGVLAVACMAAAWQLWGLLGIPITVVTFVALRVVVLKVSRRTERLYETKTQSQGVPVFAALLGGAAGGDLVVDSRGLRFVGGRRRTRSFDWTTGELRCVRIARKGRLGSAAVMTVEMVAGDTVWLEVADGPRLAEALERVPNLDVENKWG